MYAMLGTRPDLAYPVGLLDLRAIHLAHTGTVSSQSLSICIILPSSDARKLNKCFHCTLSKQKCSMTVR